MITEKGKIDFEAIHTFLQDEGVAIYYNDDSIKMSDLQLVKTTDNFVERLSVSDLFEIIMDESRRREKNTKPLFENTKYIEKSFIKTFNRLKMVQFRDSRDSINFFFGNQVVIVSKDDINCIGYDNFNFNKTYLWKENISSKVFEKKYIEMWQSSEWAKFCRNAVGEEGLEPLMRALGFLLHTYKNPSIAKLIVFADSVADSEIGANGGSGKSIIAYNALKYCRRLSFVEGKSFDEKNKFKFQSIDNESNIVLLDDIDSSFKYKTLYNAITNVFFIERKGITPIEMKFRDSPKFILTTNYGTLDTGESDIRRREVIGFSNHYNSKNTPFAEFGKIFFDDWNDTEWGQFYGFMIVCAQLYLKNGITSYRADIVNRKAVIAVKGEDIVNWVSDNFMDWYGENNRIKISILIESIPIGLRQNKLNQHISRDITDIVKVLGYDIKKVAIFEDGYTHRFLYVVEKNGLEDPLKAEKRLNLKIESQEKDDIPF